MKKILAVILCLLLMLSGCGQKAEPPVQEPLVMPQPPAAEEAPPVQPPEEEPETITLKLAALSEALAETVKLFNASQDRITVELVNYAANAGGEAEGAARLRTELLAGEGPDLICFEQWMQDIHSPIPYIGKELLIDLDPFVAHDPSLSEETLLAWQALHEYGGMYLLSGFCNIETLYCTMELYETYGAWTIDDYLALEQSLTPQQDMIYSMDSESLLTAFSSHYMEKALDPAQAACDFNNPQFAAILNGAREAGEYDGSAPGGKSVPERMAEGQLMTCYSGLRNPSDIAFDRYRSGETMAYIGWPTYDGSSGSDVILDSAVGICAQTAYPDACWEFIRYMVTEPVLFSGAMTPLYLPKLQELVDILNASDIRYEVTREDVDYMITICNQCTHLAYYDGAVMAIILEEAAPVLQGDVTAEHAAEVIQERASLYMMEQYG